MIDKRLKYKHGKRIALRGGGMDAGNQSNQDQSASMGGGNDNNQSNNTPETTRPNPHTDSGTSKTSVVSGDKMRSAARDFVQTLNHNNAIEAAKTGTKFTPYGGGSKNYKEPFFDTGLGKIIKTIGLSVIAPQLLAGTKLGTLYSGYNKAKQVAALASKFNITDKNVATSLTDTVKDKFAGFSTTGTRGPKGSPREEGDGGEPNQQNALMSEYLLLLQKMKQGVLQGEEQGRFNSLKSRLGKARGGRMNDEVRKESQVKQFTPPPEKTGILQKLFGIDTDKLYDQGFDSMNKYRERNPDNPREVLQTAGGKLSNLRHGVSTSLLRDAILKKINPGSYEMKEAPPSMNFKELKMSEEGPNKAAKGVASLLAYLGAGSNEIGTDFFSQETMEDLTANLLGLMKTDVYDTPEDKAAMLNEILENDTGGINTYLQSLAPKEKYQEDAMLFPPMRQDKMRDQDLLFMKAEEEYEDKVKNLGLGDMDG